MRSKPERRRPRLGSRAGEAESRLRRAKRADPFRIEAGRTRLDATTKTWLPEPERGAVLTFVALLILLLGPWPGYGRAFGVVFSGYANVVVRVFGIGRVSEPSFTPAPDEPREVGGEWTVALAFREPSHHDTAGVPLDTRIVGYTPLALFVALTLASSVSPRRKVVIAGIGLGLLLVRLALAIALPVARASDPSRASSWFSQAAEVAWSVLIDQPAMSYAAPLLAWWIGLALTTQPQLNRRSGRP
jgi:hypothetical protein